MSAVAKIKLQKLWELLIPLPKFGVSRNAGAACGFRDGVPVFPFQDESNTSEQRVKTVNLIGPGDDKGSGWMGQNPGIAELIRGGAVIFLRESGHHGAHPVRRFVPILEKPAASGWRPRHWVDAVLLALVKRAIEDRVETEGAEL